MDKSMIRPYMQHKDGCNSRNAISATYVDGKKIRQFGDCDCGLNDLLAELDKPGQGEVVAWTTWNFQGISLEPSPSFTVPLYRHPEQGTGRVLLDDTELERCYQRRRLSLAEAGLTAEEAHKSASEYKAGMMQARLRYLAPAKAPREVVEAGNAMRDQFWMLWDTLAKNGAGWFPDVEHIQRITTSIVNWDAALKSNTPDEHA